MSDLKPGWQRVKFGEVVRLNKETCKDPEAAGINRVIGLEHLEPGDLRVRSWAEVADGTTFSNRVRPGQVLFGKRRAYQRKVAVADFDAICSGDIYVFESADSKRLLPELLPFICQTEAFFEYAVGTSAGSLSPRTNWKSLAEYDLVLPPLEEQRRIQQLATATTDTWNSFEGAVLAARNAETALIEEFISLCERREPIGSHIKDIAYGCSVKSGPESCGVPILRIPNVLRGELDLSDLKWIELDSKQRKAFGARTGDILLVRTNGNPAYVGRSVVVRDSGQEMVFASYLLRLRVSDSLDPDYLSAMLNAPTTSRELRGSVRSSAGNYNVNTTGIKEQLIPMCSLGEQLDLVERMHALRRTAQELENRARSISVYRARLLNEALS